MDEWVGTREAANIKKVGLGQRSIARSAKLGEILAKRTGKRKWLVKVTFNNNRWDLVKLSPPVPTEQGQVVTEPTSEKTVQDARLKEHFDQTGAAAKRLASRVEKLVYYRDSEHEIHACEGNIVDGLRFFGRRVPDDMERSIGPGLVRCVLAHYEHKFDRLYCGCFEGVIMENASQELADNLLRLANDTNFEACPICPGCQGITGMYPIGRDWIRIKDKETGKKSYMPADF